MKNAVYMVLFVVVCFSAGYFHGQLSSHIDTSVAFESTPTVKMFASRQVVSNRN
ncbi:hypothetical protein B9G69_005270 [Bdellovibrio sp. SKB1291214]|uniref:hypothetical protein n=1 Tax=Bdellovibrio sp. SKB1291214 TaxID=1732569 RepID=UPI001595B1CA|nr:hypothetical protein [Bdellovibrio sp. SKB1291214]UYL09985.1 hypothetical protein B9G69_005270 [Bdellovibrio sp. SKB1291214]